MTDAITNILSGMSSVMTTLFTPAAGAGDNTLLYVALLPVVAGVVRRAVALVKSAGN